MSIVTFQDYMPTPRYDGTPWTRVLIEEAATEEGPWTQIDDILLVPADTDPTQPRARSFTTQNGTLIEGWYRVTFKDAAAHLLLTDPVQNIPGSDINFRPTITEVARKIMSRTRDRYGNLVGTFTQNTQPTDTQAAGIITGVLTEIADYIGDEVPEAFRDDAANVAAIRAAMQIELDFYSDQVNTGRSIYPQLKEQYEEALLALTKAMSSDDPNTPGVDPSSVTATGASFGFPAEPFFTRDQVW